MDGALVKEERAGMDHFFFLGVGLEILVGLVFVQEYLLLLPKGGGGRGAHFVTPRVLTWSTVNGVCN